MNQEPSFDESAQREVTEYIGTRIAKVVGISIAVVIGIIVVGLVLAWLVQFLWNETLVPMFGWPSVSYWQAFALFILAKIVFGFGNSGGFTPKKSPQDHKRDAGAHEWWRHRASSRPSEEPDTSDDNFKKYWQQEGRAAFEEFLSKKDPR